jgi:conjugal transfer mating pair stabilization protein TraG
MPYGQYEVIVYGGGQVYQSVFNAVALMAGTGPIDSLFRVMILLGLLLGILKAMGDFNFTSLMRWFITCAIIYGVLWAPKVQVAITDRLDTGFPSAVVGNVPLGVAFVAATSSEIGDTVIKSTEQAFADPQGLAYSNSGLIYGAKLYNQMRGWRILDPVFAQNMESFMTNCTYNDLLSNYITVGQLQSASNLWGFIRDSASPSAAFPYSSSSGSQPSIITCQQGAQNLDGAWSSEIPNNEAAQEVRLNPSINTGAAQSTMATALGALTTATGLASTDAAANFQQVLTINALKQAMSGYVAQNGGSLVGTLGQTQAQLQTQDTQQMIGATAEKALITLQIVITVLFIGMFPVLAPAFLLPGLGLQMMRGYFGGFVYLQLWGPMYVILNKVMMWQVYHQTAAATYMPTGTSYALTFGDLNSVGALNADLAGVAGCMAAAIPMIAGMLTKGAIAGAEAAANGVMHTFQRSAEAAGTAMSTGNFSYGTTAVDTHQFHNTQGNRFDTSAYSNFGGSTRVDDSGNTISQARDGTVFMQAANSNLPFTAKIGESLSAAANQNSSRYRDESQAVDKTYSQAQAAVSARINEYSAATTAGTARTISDGVDDRSGMREVFEKRDQASASIAHRLGISQADANSLVDYVAGEGGVDGRLGIGRSFGPVNASAGFGASLKAGRKGDHSQSDSTQTSVDIAKQELESSGYTRAKDHATQQFATDLWARTYGSTSGFRNVTSSTFSDSSSVSASRKMLDTEGQRWAETADFAQRHDFSRDENLNNRIANYFGNRYRNGNDPVRDANGEVIPLGALLNPVGPNAHEISELRNEALQRDIFPAYLQGLAADPRVHARVDTPLPTIPGLSGIRPEQASVSAPHGFDSLVRGQLSGAPDRRAISSPEADGLSGIGADVHGAARLVDKAEGQSPKLDERRSRVEAGHYLTGAKRIKAPV